MTRRQNLQLSNSFHTEPGKRGLCCLRQKLLPKHFTVRTAMTLSGSHAVFSVLVSDTHVHVYASVRPQVTCWTGSQTFRVQAIAVPLQLDIEATFPKKAPNQYW